MLLIWNLISTGADCTLDYNMSLKVKTYIMKQITKRLNKTKRITAIRMMRTLILNTRELMP